MKRGQISNRWRRPKYNVIIDQSVMFMPIPKSPAIFIHTRTLLGITQIITLFATITLRNQK